MSSPTGTDAGAAVPDGGPVVYDLAADCTAGDLEEGALYHATVNGTVEYGVFVDLSENVSGLVHDSNLVGTYDVGDDLIVELGEIRPDGDLSFEEVQVADYAEEQVVHGAETTVAALADHTGETVVVEGEVVQIKQTGGPTIFHVRDTTGVVPCAAFEEAGVRAYPDVEIDDIVRWPAAPRSATAVCRSNSTR